MKRSVSICYLGNPDFDTRVNNLFDSLTSAGYDVKVVGFDWRNSEVKSSTGDKTIFKLKKSRFSLLFYVRFAYLISRWLLKSKSYYYIAEDVYTLPFVTFFAGMKKAKVIYNSRELFMALAGLRNKPMVQRGIAAIEKMFIYKADLVLTTGDMDSKYIKKYYKIENVITIRNLPKLMKPTEVVDLRQKYNIPADKKILFYQGVLFEGRGIGVILEVLPMLNDFVFVLCGSGEHQEKYKKIASDLGVAERVIFAGAKHQNELINYTAGADLGIALIENISESYYYALPNKLFEYIMAGVPVLISDLPQMKKVVDEYNVGKVLDIDDKEKLVNAILSIMNDDNKYQLLKDNCIVAAQELNWQKEFGKLEMSMENLD